MGGCVFDTTPSPGNAKKAQSEWGYGKFQNKPVFKYYYFL